MILKQYDETSNAVINPSNLIDEIPGIPEVAVSCFARSTFERMLDSVTNHKIAESASANHVTKVYEADCKGKRIALVNAEVSAPACVALFEDVFAMGIKKLILFGICGVLKQQYQRLFNYYSYFCTQR